MAKEKQGFLARKNVVISARRYGIDALGAMAQGLFASLLIGTILGALLAQAAGGGICKAAFSLFAMKEVTFNISPVFILITVVGIVAVAMLTAGAEGLKVRKLRPVEMITEE